MNARMLCRLAQALSCVLACIGCAGSTARPSADEVSRGGSRPVASATGATCAFDETAVLEAGERLALRGLQPGDARRRGEALASAKSALETGSPAQATAALHAWARWNELPFDRAEARALVEQHLAAPEAPRRRAAWRALSALGRMEGLCESSMALIDDPDPSLRADALRFVGAACGGLVEARTEQVALSALDEARARGGWSRACRSIRGLRLGPGLQQRLLDAALDGDEDAAAVLEFAPAKSREFVQRLLAATAIDRSAIELAGACLRGGIAESDQPLVAHAALSWWKARVGSELGAGTVALRLLELHGSSTEAASLLERCAGDAECLRVAGVLAARAR